MRMVSSVATVAGSAIVGFDSEAVERKGNRVSSKVTWRDVITRRV